MSDEFDDLFVEEQELNKSLLRDILKGRVTLTEKGNVMFEREFTAIQSLLLYLLAKKALAERDIVDDERAGPKEIHLKTGIPEGTAKGKVRELDGKVLVNEDGAYLIPNHALHKVKKIIEGKNG